MITSILSFRHYHNHLCLEVVLSVITSIRGTYTDILTTSLEVVLSVITSLHFDYYRFHLLCLEVVLSVITSIR